MATHRSTPAYEVPHVNGMASGVNAVPAPPDLLHDDRIPQPVREAIRTIADTFRRKNADYADGSSWRSNFADVARQMAFDDLDAAEVLIAVKQARLKSLRANGRTPQNESVADTVLDRAVYAVIALAIYLEDTQ